MSRSRMFRDDEPLESRSVSPRTTIVGGRPPEDRAELPPVPTGIQKLLRLASVDEPFREELLRRRAAVASAADVELTATEHAILEGIPAAQLEQMVVAMPPPPASRRTFLRQTASTAVMLLGGAVLAECVGCGKRQSAPAGIRPDMPSAQEGADGATDAVMLPDGPQPPQPPQPPTWEGPPIRPEDMPPPAGMQPDWPPGPSDEEPVPPRPEVDEMTSEGGIAPHVPEPADAGEPEVERPEVSHPTRGILSDGPLLRPAAPVTSTTGGAAPDMPPMKK